MCAVMIFVVVVYMQRFCDQTTEYASRKPAARSMLNNYDAPPPTYCARCLYALAYNRYIYEINSGFSLQPSSSAFRSAAGLACFWLDDELLSYNLLLLNAGWRHL